MNVDRLGTQQSSTPESGPRRVGRRALRRRFTACVAAFLVPLMVVDPQSAIAMFNEARAHCTMSAAGIARRITKAFAHAANGTRTPGTGSVEYAHADNGTQDPGSRAD